MKTLVSGILAVCLVALDWELAQRALAGEDWRWLLVGHCGLCVLGAALIFWCVPAAEKARYQPAVYLFPVMVTLPVLGLGLALGISILAVPGRRNLPTSRDYLSLSELSPTGGYDSYSYGASLSSIADIMRGGDARKRRDATLALKDLKTADSLPILRRLTQDDDEIVRLFALGEKRRITNEFEERSRRLSEKRRKKEATVPDLLHLAESYLEEVEVGLPEDEMQRSALLERALDVLGEARRQAPERLDIEFDILRCALASYDVGVAERAFYRLKEAKGLRERIGLLQCEYYFQKGDWQNLADRLASLPLHFRSSPRMENVLELWSPAVDRWAGRLS